MPSCTSVTSAGSTPVGQSNDPSIRFSFSGSGQSHREAKLASRRVVSTNCGQKTPVFSKHFVLARDCTLAGTSSEAPVQSISSEFSPSDGTGHYSKTLRWQSPSGK